MPRRRPPMSTVRISTLICASTFVVFSATATAIVAALCLCLSIQLRIVDHESNRHVRDFPGPGAVPYEFNGVTYYILPLDSAK